MRSTSDKLNPSEKERPQDNHDPKQAETDLESQARLFLVSEPFSIPSRAEIEALHNKDYARAAEIYFRRKPTPVEVEEYRRAIETSHQVAADALSHQDYERAAEAYLRHKPSPAEVEAYRRAVQAYVRRKHLLHRSVPQDP